MHRVSYLIEKGVDAQSILVLTFTRKASWEMLERVETLLTCLIMIDTTQQ